MKPGNGFGPLLEIGDGLLYLRAFGSGLVHVVDPTPLEKKFGGTSFKSLCNRAIGGLVSRLTNMPTYPLCPTCKKRLEARAK